MPAVPPPRWVGQSELSQLMQDAGTAVNSSSSSSGTAAGGVGRRAFNKPAFITLFNQSCAWWPRAAVQRGVTDTRPAGGLVPTDQESGSCVIIILCRCVSLRQRSLVLAPGPWVFAPPPAAAECPASSSGGLPRSCMFIALPVTWAFLRTQHAATAQPKLQRHVADGGTRTRPALQLTCSPGLGNCVHN